MIVRPAGVVGHHRTPSPVTGLPITVLDAEQGGDQSVIAPWKGSGGGWGGAAQLDQQPLHRHAQQGMTQKLINDETNGAEAVPSSTSIHG